MNERIEKLTGLLHRQHVPLGGMRNPEKCSRCGPGAERLVGAMDNGTLTRELMIEVAEQLDLQADQVQAALTALDSGSAS